jgi:2-polyprenyl-3-methyl-5-hydroxy-6-metoxy-1,4-benzoquinol methylase
MPNLELCKADIVAGPVERGAFDLVTARAMLHHVADARAAIANMVASLKAGGALLLIEPDFLPVSIAEPQEVHAFVNEESIIRLGGHLRLDWLRSA